MFHPDLSLVREFPRLMVRGFILLAIFLPGCGQPNPLSKHGVHIEWRDEGATSGHPFIVVWCEYQGKKIDSPLHFGGIEDPEVDFSDLDHDTIPEIIYHNGKYREVLSFKPAKDGNPPYFVILENNPRF